MNAAEKIKQWVQKNVPRVVLLNCQDIRVLLDVYYYMSSCQAESTEAIDRIKAQMPYWFDSLEHEYLLYFADKKALADLCNNYCILLSENYGMYPEWAQMLAEENYKICTNLYLKLQ